MTNIHDTKIELLNDLYLIVAGTDLSNSEINKTALFAYIYQQSEIEENKLDEVCEYTGDDDDSNDPGNLAKGGDIERPMGWDIDSWNKRKNS